MRLPPKVFCATSFFYACLDPSDTHHEAGSDLVERAVRSATDLLTTWDVVSETVTLLRYRATYQAARAFVTTIRPSLEIVTYGDEVRTEAEQVFLRLGKERRLSYCDAVSYVVVSRQLDHLPCLAFDRDFLALGLTVLR